VSVMRISNMVVRPHSQNPWQLASPRSSVAAGGRGASAVGVDESGVLAPAAFHARQLMQENILGGESAVPHKCLHSSATSSCRMCDQSAHFTRQGMLKGYLGSAAIVGSGHIQRRMVVP
jgi:hypothetical protein